MRYEKLPINYGYEKEKYGEERDIYNKKYVRFWVISTIILGVFFIMVVSIFLILIYNDKFKSVITQTVSPLFNASVFVFNDYDFSPNTIDNFYNNFTILNLNNIGCNAT